MSAIMVAVSRNLGLGFSRSEALPFAIIARHKPAALAVARVDTARSVCRDPRTVDAIVRIKAPCAAARPRTQRRVEPRPSDASRPADGREPSSLSDD
jgi:hypothetical protein